MSAIYQIRKATPKVLYYMKQSTGAKGWLLNQHYQKLKSQMNSLPLFNLNLLGIVLGIEGMEIKKGFRN
jgi:hypothetical protein